jgi:hypothetical protein
MRASHALGLLSIVAPLAGCASSVDPAARSDAAARKAATIAAPPAGALAPMPLAAGQWVRHRMTLPNGQQALRTQKILEQRGDAFRYEVVSDTDQGRTVEQLLVTFGSDRRHPRVELLGLRRKDPKGRVVEMSARELSRPLVTNDDYRAMAASLVAPWPPTVQEPAVVPAGRFEGCYRIRRATNFGRRDERVTDSWRHPSVPLSGLVRMQDNHSFVSELVAYGTAGARSDF